LKPIKIAVRAPSKPSPKPIKIAVRAPPKVVATVAASNIKKQETAFNKWLVTAEGVHATRFCKSLGVENRPQIYDGCLEDMMVMKNEAIAKLGALTAEEFLSKSKSVDTSKRYCIASGDPHFTSYDRDIYHLQEQGIFVIAGSDDNQFEVQERVKKNGANVPGVPSCIIGAAVRFGDVYVEVDVYNYGKIRVNGAPVDLAKDTTKTYGGVQVRYGKQNIAWRGNNAQTTAMKITGPGGFSVMVEGGYCGTLEVNAPAAYFGKMRGLCGNADGTASNADYSAPDGRVMDVKRGAKNWQMSGYGGPTSPLSKWQLAWKPTGVECLFASGCDALPGTTTRTKRVAAKAAPSPASVSAPKSAKAAPVSVSVSVSAPKSSKAGAKAAPSPASVSGSTVKAAPSSASVSAPKSAKAAPVSVSAPKGAKAGAKAAPSPASVSIVNEIVAANLKSNKKLTSFQQSVVRLINDASEQQLKLEVANKKNFDGASVTLSTETTKLALEKTHLKKLYDESIRLNGTIQAHYKKIIADTAYLTSLDKMKPEFFKSLDNVWGHIQSVKTTVSVKLVNDNYKTEMLHLLDHLHLNARNISGYVATAFINHYNKYKALITEEDSSYTTDLARLAALSAEYKVNQQKVADLEKERVRIQTIMNEFKAAYDMSALQRDDFDALIKKIMDIFDNKNCIR
jgi:hypothetical protein